VGGGRGQWLNGRAVAATNGGAGGDVGAVTSAGRQQTCETREKRAGEGRDRAGELLVRGKVLRVNASLD
jgi:hypothetical protein